MKRRTALSLLASAPVVLAAPALASRPTYVVINDFQLICVSWVSDPIHKAVYKK